VHREPGDRRRREREATEVIDSRKEEREEIRERSSLIFWEYMMHL